VLPIPSEFRLRDRGAKPIIHFFRHEGRGWQQMGANYTPGPMVVN
jgi:hypothetical protein